MGITATNKLMAFLHVTLPQWVAGKLPKSVVRFAAVRLFAHASTTKFTDRTPDSISIWDALGAWEAA